jgi:hypothetical protein
MKQQELLWGVYVPHNGIAQIMAKDRIRRVPVAEANEPGHICGMACRVGYTGKSEQDLAIYRLKITYDAHSPSITLPAFFVVDGGVFVEYEEWCRTNKKATYSKSDEQTLQRI